MADECKRLGDAMGEWRLLKEDSKELLTLAAHLWYLLHAGSEPTTPVKGHARLEAGPRPTTAADLKAEKSHPHTPCFPP